MALLFVYDMTLIESHNRLFNYMFDEDTVKRYLDLDPDVTICCNVKFDELYAMNGNGFDSRLVKIAGIRKLNSFSTAIGDVIYDYVQLSKSIRQSDIVIIRMPSLLSALAFLIASKLKRTVITEMVGDPVLSYWYHQNQLGKIIAPIMWALTRSVLWRSKYSIYVTEKYLQRKYPTRGRSIACSNVILKSIDSEVLANRLKRIESIGEGREVVLGTVGNLSMRFKGQHFVIKALAFTKEQTSELNFRYELVGDGDRVRIETIASKEKVEGHVVFRGLLNREQLDEWYNSIDIYIQPSLHEGLPRAVIEAMSHGLTCIGSDVAGIPELLDQKFIVDSKNMSRSISKLLLMLKKDDLVSQAYRNVEASKKYLYNRIEARRQEFYEMVVMQKGVL